MILIRTCSNAMVGMGHLSRMLTLAATMRDDFGQDVVFLVNCNAASLDLIRHKGFQNIEYSADTPDCLAEVLATLPVARITICVIDAPDISADEINLYKRHGMRVAVLVCKSAARLLVDVNVFPVAHYDYAALGWAGYQGLLLGGSDFVLLPKEFIIRRSEGAIPYEKRRKILVTMGGADPNRLTLMVMQSLRSLASKVPVEIVLGHNCCCKDEARRLNKEYGSIFALRENVEEMAAVMADAALAITALGITIYELAIMGVPTFVINNYSHDDADIDGLEKLGFMQLLGNYRRLTEESLREALQLLWDNQEVRSAMAATAAMLTDGGGARRICMALLNQTGAQ